MLLYLYFYKFKLFFKKISMYLKKAILIFVFLFWVFFNSHLFAAEDWFKVDEVIWNSVKLSWNANSEVPYNQVFYWEASSPNWVYPNETDILDGLNSITIDKLNANSDYYFYLVWFGSDWEKVLSSAEITAKTKDSLNSSWFKLNDAYQIWKNVIRLNFSNNLLSSQTGSDLSFKIESVTNPSDYFDVVSFEIPEEEKNVLFLVLSWEPKVSSEYKVVALSVFDENKNNIEYWVDSEASFVWVNLETPKDDFNSAGPNETETTQTPEKKEEVVEEKTPEKKEPVNHKKQTKNGEDLKETDVKKDVKWVSKDKSNLPKTWPEYLILLFLALMIWTVFFIPKYRK